MTNSKLIILKVIDSLSSEDKNIFQTSFGLKALKTEGYKSLKEVREFLHLRDYHSKPKREERPKNRRNGVNALNTEENRERSKERTLNSVCFVCGETGHTIASCKVDKKKLPKCPRKLKNGNICNKQAWHNPKGCKAYEEFLQRKRENSINRRKNDQTNALEEEKESDQEETRPSDDEEIPEGEHYESSNIEVSEVIPTELTINNVKSKLKKSEFIIHTKHEKRSIMGLF